MFIIPEMIHLFHSTKKKLFQVETKTESADQKFKRSEIFFRNVVIKLW